MGGTPNYAYRDGQRLAPMVAYDLDRMAKAFQAETGETLHVADGGGLRTRVEQQELWDGYQAYLRGTGPFHNLAAHPDDPRAYHVESNPNGARAADLYDSGAVGGVSSGTGPRHQWMLANAHRFNFENEGMTFSKVEPWHKRWTGTDPWATPPEEDDMTPEERKMLTEIHARVHKGLTGDRIAAAVWARGGTGALLKRISTRVSKGLTGPRIAAAVWARAGAGNLLKQIAAAAGDEIEVDSKEIAAIILDDLGEGTAKAVADELAKRLKS